MAFFDSENIKIRAVELFLIELILFIIIWLVHNFLATFITIIFSAIFLFIFIISIIAELIEQSKVPRFYFYAMVISVLTPWIAAAIAIFVIEIDWGVG